MPQIENSNVKVYNISHSLPFFLILSDLRRAIVLFATNAFVSFIHNTYNSTSHTLQLKCYNVIVLHALDMQI